MAEKDAAAKLAAATRYLALNSARLRESKGWSQQEAADAAGLDPKHYQRVEYGSLNPSLRTIVRLAHGFKVKAHELLKPTRGSLPKRARGRPRTARE